MISQKYNLVPPGGTKCVCIYIYMLYTYIQYIDIPTCFLEAIM